MRPSGEHESGLPKFNEAEAEWQRELAAREPDPTPEQLALVRRIFRLLPNSRGHQ